jgi:hypothetical protein
LYIITGSVASAAGIVTALIGMQRIFYESQSERFVGFAVGW